MSNQNQIKTQTSHQQNDLEILSHKQESLKILATEAQRNTEKI